MEWKYMKIFLLVLLCQVNYDISFAQSCISMSYDSNGNRTHVSIDRCAIKKEIIKKDMIRNEMSEDEIEMHLSVYPNPNEGRVNVKMEAYGGILSRYEMYDVKGLLVCKGNFTDEVTINIENQRAGIYLLRIIGGENVFSKIILKL